MNLFHNALKMDDRYQHKGNFASRKHKYLPQRHTRTPPGHSESYNKFANDGSFMEMFKRRMDEQNEKKETNNTDSRTTTTATTSSNDGACQSSSGEAVNARTSSPVVSTSEPKAQSTNTTKPGFLSFVGKRRGGKVLKTGAVKKVKKEDEDGSSGNKDAWSQYLDEVKKYKSQMCVDEDQTRPLVK